MTFIRSTFAAPSAAVRILFCAVSVALVAPTGAAQEAQAVWTLRREVVIDGAVPELAYLTAASRAMVGRDGSVIVPQEEERVLRIFDSTGRYIRSIGPQLHDAQEFHTIGRMGWVGDSLWVLDEPNTRIAYFRSEGTILGFEADWILARLGSRTAHLIALLENGHALALSQTRITPDGEIDPNATAELRLIARSGRSQTLSDFPIASDFARFRRPGSSDAFVVIPQLFMEAPLVGASPIGKEVVLVERPTPTSDEGRFVVRRFGIDGRQTAEHVINFTAARMNLADAHLLIDSLADAWTPVAPRDSADHVKAIARSTISGALRIPSYYPPFSQMVVGTDGTIWLRTYLNRARWIAIDTAGSPAGEITLAADAALLYASGDRIWVVEPDANGIPGIVRYVVQRGGAVN